MSGPIKPGDMVMLVWACCSEGRRHIGTHDTVLVVGPGGSRCDFCRTIQRGVMVECESGNTFPLTWLIKLEPPSTPVNIERTEEAEV